MTDSEAIVRIRDHFEVHHRDGRPHPYLDEAVEMAIKALEKQIPKKIILRWSTMKCPVCENSSEIKKTKGYNFCPNCGQRWDWSGE